VMGNWTGIVAAAGTPRATVVKISTEVTKILRAPEMSKRLTEMGADPMGGTPEDFGKLIKAETAALWQSGQGLRRESGLIRPEPIIGSILRVVRE